MTGATTEQGRLSGRLPGNEHSVKDLQDQFEITAHPQNAAAARDRVKQAAVRAGFGRPTSRTSRSRSARRRPTPSFTARRTATSRIIVSCWFSPKDGAFHVEIRDQGQGFDPNQVRDEEDTDALGGRGLRLMRALMDKLLLFYDGHGMSVRLTKHLPRPGRLRNVIIEARISGGAVRLSGTASCPSLCITPALVADMKTVSVRCPPPVQSPRAKDRPPPPLP